MKSEQWSDDGRWWRLHFEALETGDEMPKKIWKN